MLPVTSPYSHLLHLSLLLYIVPYLYSYYNNNVLEQSYSLEAAVVDSWNKIIQHPSIMFRKAVIGINCNVDLIVSGTALLGRMNAIPSMAVDREIIDSLEDLESAFGYSFMNGAPSERLADQTTFDTALHSAEHLGETSQLQYHIGGNAALMAQKIASSFPRTTTILVGPIGPRAQALLHPAISTSSNSTRISRDELHIIMEFKQGEIWGEYVAPASSRFITSHDVFSGSAIVLDMFFKTIAQTRPDLVILSGVHLLEFQPTQMRLEKLRLIKRNLLQISPGIPTHLELGSMAEPYYVRQVLHRIVPYVNSLGLNEQELAYLSHIGDGPYTDEFPIRGSAIHVHKVVEILYWLMSNFGHDNSDPEAKKAHFRLERIHFHCLTFQIMISRGTDWSNLAAGLAAAARLAGRQACNIQNQVDTDLLELRTSPRHLLDKELGKVYNFKPHNPVASWFRGDVLLIYTPVLVCKFPMKTVGLDDAISATGLIFSQFYRLGGKNVMKW